MSCTDLALTSTPFLCPYWQTYVAYWPTTRLGCQNRKCTCVNNKCIRSRNIRIITLTMDRLNECKIVMLTRRRWTLHYYITQCTGNSISWGSEELEIRCSKENWHPEKLGPQAPGWVTQENGKETRLWPIVWGSICCSTVRSPTPSHTQPFQIKWEVCFSKTCVARYDCVVVMILHAYVDVYVLCVCIVGHSYTTLDHVFVYDTVSPILAHFSGILVYTLALNIACPVGSITRIWH